MAPGITDGMIAGGGVSLTAIASWALFNVVRDYFRGKNGNGNGKGKEAVDIALVKQTVDDNKSILVSLSNSHAETNRHLATQTEVLRSIHAELKNNERSS